MTWTYTLDPLNVPRDAVRLFVGDTDSTKQLLQDEEIAWFLNQRGGRPIQAAILACEALATKYAGQVDVTLGKMSLSNSQRSAAYKGRAEELRTRLGGSAVRMLVGGTSYMQRCVARSNRDTIQPVTEVGGEDGLDYSDGLISRWL